MRNNAAERCIKCGMQKVSLVAIHPAADYACNEVSPWQVCGVLFKLFVSHFLIL